ncbi:MAG: uracil-DNA glycosylase [bacterium]
MKNKKEKDRSENLLNNAGYYELLDAAKQKVREMKDRGQRDVLFPKSVSLVQKKRDGSEKTELLKEVAGKAELCRKCPLGDTRIKSVFGVGNPDAAVIFIGEGPGYDEDRQGFPFVGRAGKLLDKMLASINLDRNKAYIANVVKCHPMIDPGNPEKRGNDRPPSYEEASQCIHFLKEQIRIIKPKILCILGASALRYVIGIEEGIGQVRGRFIDYEGIKTLITYHPAALLRNPSLKLKSWQDLQMLRDAIQQISS